MALFLSIRMSIFQQPIWETQKEQSKTSPSIFLTPTSHIWQPTHQSRPFSDSDDEEHLLQRVGLAYYGSALSNHSHKPNVTPSIPLLMEKGKRDKTRTAENFKRKNCLEIINCIFQTHVQTQSVSNWLKEWKFNSPIWECQVQLFWIISIIYTLIQKK